MSPIEGQEHISNGNPENPSRRTFFEKAGNIILTTAGVTVGVISLAGCGENYREKIDEKEIYNSRYNYQKYLYSGTYEIEVYGDGDISLDLNEFQKISGDYILINNIYKDENYEGIEKITFTINSPTFIDLRIENIGGEYINFKLYKIK